MKPKVYIETSVISYLTARPNRDVVVAARQAITQDWWENHRNRFDLMLWLPPDRPLLRTGGKIIGTGLIFLSLNWSRKKC